MHSQEGGPFTKGQIPAAACATCSLMQELLQKFQKRQFKYNFYHHPASGPSISNIGGHSCSLLCSSGAQEVVEKNSQCVNIT